MNKESFLEEIKENSLEELELIYATQKDLYLEEEMAVIKEKIDELTEKQEKEKQEKIKKLIPKEIECPKCFGPNLFENEECCFCGYKFDKNKYYTLEYYENQEESTENKEEEESESYLFQYVISYFIPLIAFILGAIMLTNENIDRRKIGKNCIIIGIVSMIINTIIICIVLLNL